uniref:Uncharacterized protein n=1 Tax=Neogobius melanostomus TaxID=47308 RepID=A0A8C6TSJ9_9GOBI
YYCVLFMQTDNARERALDNMMDGVLEVKKEYVLKMEIPTPEFVLTKPESQWSEEEKKMYKEYERKSKELNEEKEKYRKVMEAEMKKLQTATMEATEKFDETIAKLFERKMKCEMAVNQVKHYIFFYSKCKDPSSSGGVLYRQDEIGEEVMRCEEDLEQFRMTYDTIVAEDKVGFILIQKEFSDVPGHFVDELYKLFKRRPRAQKMRDPAQCGSLALDNLGKLLKAVDEMDSHQNMPQDLNPIIWERFCVFRRTKIEKEHKVKMNALTFAEMQAFLQKRREEERATNEEIKVISEELERLHKVKNRFAVDIMVQVLLKQSQVEVPNTELTADYSDSVLLHRSVVEDLNKNIRVGQSSISTMVECKDFRKHIIQQEWEHKKRRMQIEDLQSKTRDIQTFKISEEQREVILSSTKSHLKNVEHRRKKIEQLERQVKMYVYTFVWFVETDNPSLKAEERYQEILQRRKLKDLAQAQVEELGFLWAEVERLRTKNFPSLNHQCILGGNLPMVC